ncbi:hypothetical protein DEO72_LG7g1612 [Vigna unguiculata]|uniref:Uncharacterized protein n=1 Tax=Vigna unguiculata TaxID=3917 RepID=A0A4D6MID3_VIGUN|nr:hypothetical protein DEO72_LG7g1612 [Vigna unguiculata]
MSFLTDISGNSISPDSGPFSPLADPAPLADPVPSRTALIFFTFFPFLGRGGNSAFLFVPLCTCTSTTDSFKLGTSVFPAALALAAISFLSVWKSAKSNPSQYKDMGMDELSAGAKEVVAMLLKFVDKLPTKGLVRVYNAVHPIIDIEGHMAQSGKKNLALFQTLRQEMAAKAKAAGKTDVPNLKESVVEVQVHSGTKRKAELPPRPRKGKNVKKVRAGLLGTGSASGAGSASGEKGRCV